MHLECYIPCARVEASIQLEDTRGQGFFKKGATSFQIKRALILVINFLALQLSDRDLTKLPGVTVKTTAGGGSIANFQEEP